MSDFSDWYETTEHCRLSKRDPSKSCVDNWSRYELQEYLEERGFAVYDHEDTEDLRLAVKLHSMEERDEDNQR